MLGKYPPVAGERETLRKIAKGFSIARFGDGEVKVMEKLFYAREPEPVPKLAAELLSIARRPHKQCLIGIPTMDPAGDRYYNWKKSRARFAKHFPPNKGHQYWSALITRPDCGTRWMDTREYYEAMIQLWADKRDLVVVSEPDSKLLAYVRGTHCGSVWPVTCPAYGAYGEIDRLTSQTLALMPDLVLLSCGPTATALAHRLTVAGLQAVDLGSIGGFLLRWHGNGPQPTSEQEYKAERDTQYGPDDYRQRTGELQG